MPCSLVGNAAGTVVQDGWAQWKSKAEQFREDAITFLEELLNNPDFNMEPIPVDIDFDMASATLGTSFVKPVSPSRPDLEFGTFIAPTEPGIDSVDPPTYSTIPTYSGSIPSITLPSPPDALTDSPPEDIPDLDEVTLPDVPTLTLPDVPTLRTITLPSDPSISLPTFSGTLPDDSDLAAPANTFGFTEVAYSGEVLDEVVARVLTMLEGGTGLPDEIWDALWNKAKSREEDAGVKLIQEATEEWAARGFTLPPGALVGRVAAARQAVQNTAATLSRDIFIKAAEMEQNNIQFAVAQGIALENLLIGQHNAEMQRAFDSARYTLEASINIFNAKVTLYNARLQGYQTQASVFKTLIEAELAELEVYKAQLAGQQLIGELNKQDVDIYRARIESVTAAADVYKTQVAGVEAAVRANATLIDAYKAQVEAYGERVKAKATEAQIYSETIRGELSKAQIYEIETNTFAKRIDAWRTETQALGEQKKISLDMNESKIRLFAARVDAYRSQIQAEAERIRAGASVYDAEARIFSSELGAETARVEAEGRQFQLALEKAKSEADLEVKKADLSINQVQRLLALELERIKTVNNVHAQLAAATMAAVNLSASISEGASNSASCTYDAT